MMNNGYVSKCINGDLRVGDDVLHLPVDDYPIMRGRVTEIYPAGSKEATETTDNPGDCIHVDYTVGLRTDERIAEIEAVFSDLYNGPRIIEDIPLDDVIDSQDCLIRISERSDEEKNLIDQCEGCAVSTAFAILTELIAPELIAELDAQSGGSYKL